MLTAKTELFFLFGFYMYLSYSTPITFFFNQILYLSIFKGIKLQICWIPKS